MHDDPPFSHVVSDVSELRADLYPEPPQRAWDKEVGVLDEHCRDFLARSPFMLLATSGSDGRCDVSPRGGPPGFVRVLDERRLAFADLTGNRRIDSLRHVVENPQVGMLFLLPGFRETLRVNGRAYLTRDPELLRRTDVPARTADLAIGVEVETAFLHCAKAFIRSQLWEPESWPDRDSLPSAARILRDHAELPQSLEAVDAHLEEAYTTKLW